MTDITQAIRGIKAGTTTHGTTSVTVPDKYGNPHVIKFSRSSDVPVYARIKLKVLRVIPHRWAADPAGYFRLYQ